MQQTWTILQHDGPNQLVALCFAEVPQSDAEPFYQFHSFTVSPIQTKCPLPAPPPLHRAPTHMDCYMHGGLMTSTHGLLSKTMALITSDCA